MNSDKSKTREASERASSRAVRAIPPRPAPVSVSQIEKRGAGVNFSIQFDCVSWIDIGNADETRKILVHPIFISSLNHISLKRRPTHQPKIQPRGRKHRRLDYETAHSQHNMKSHPRRWRYDTKFFFSRGIWRAGAMEIFVSRGRAVSRGWTRGLQLPDYYQLVYIYIYNQLKQATCEKIDSYMRAAGLTTFKKETEKE